MILSGKTVQQWKDWIAIEFALAPEKRHAPDNMLEAFRDALEVIEEVVPEQQALELVKTPEPEKPDTKKPEPESFYKGNEGDLQTVDVYAKEVTVPVTDEDGVVTFTFTAARGAPNGRPRIYEFVGKAVPEWYSLLQQVDLHLDVKYRRYGQDRRMEEVEEYVPHKTTNWGANGYDPKVSKDIEETKAATKPASVTKAPKTKKKGEDDSDAMWG